MTQELHYTSAPRGLRPGSSGYCTVASTLGMVGPLVERLESLSGYRHVYPPHDPNAGRNPVVYSHFRVDLGGRTASILSRVCDSGLDHTDRTNKYAHHVVLDESELPAGGPAWLLGRPGFMSASWSGEPRILDVGRPAPRGDRAPGQCSHWGDVTGDAGWGGVVAESLLETPKRPIFLVYEPGVELLPLLAEALALLPPARRWHVNFSTYFTKLPADLVCTVRGVLRDSPEARHARRVLDALIVDLSAAPAPPAGGPLVHQARTGEAPAVSAPQSHTPRDSPSGLTLAGRATPPPSHKPRPHSAPPEAPLYGVAPPPPPVATTRPEPAYSGSPGATPPKRRLTGPLIIAATILNLALLAGNVYLWTARPRPEPTPPPPPPPVAKRDAVAVAPPEPAASVDPPKPTDAVKPRRKAEGKNHDQGTASIPNKSATRHDGDGRKKSNDQSGTKAKGSAPDTETKESPTKGAAEASVTKTAPAAPKIDTEKTVESAAKSEPKEVGIERPNDANIVNEPRPIEKTEEKREPEIKYIENSLPTPDKRYEQKVVTLGPKPDGATPQLEIQGVVVSPEVDPGERWSLATTRDSWTVSFNKRDFSNELKLRPVAQFFVRDSALWFRWTGDASKGTMQQACESLRDCLLTISWPDGAQERYLLRKLLKGKAFDVAAEIGAGRFDKKSRRFRPEWASVEGAPSVPIKLQDVRLRAKSPQGDEGEIVLKQTPRSPSFGHVFETTQKNIKLTVYPGKPEEKDERGDIVVAFDLAPGAIYQTTESLSKKINIISNQIISLNGPIPMNNAQDPKIQGLEQDRRKLEDELTRWKDVAACYNFRLSFRLTIDVDGQTVEVARVGQ